MVSKQREGKTDSHSGNKDLRVEGSSGSNNPGRGEGGGGQAGVCVLSRAGREVGWASGDSPVS